MKPAAFFQKYNSGVWSIAKTIYIKLFVRNNSSRVKYLRDAGAIIGQDVKVPGLTGFGTEPWLISIGNHVYFAGGGVLTC